MATVTMRVRARAQIGTPLAGQPHPNRLERAPEAGAEPDRTWGNGARAGPAGAGAGARSPFRSNHFPFRPYLLVEVAALPRLVLRLGFAFEPECGMADRNIESLNAHSFQYTLLLALSWRSRPVPVASAVFATA